MGKNTKIEWTATYHPDGTVTPGHTWNPWQGCHKVSDGCRECFMYREKKRYGQDPTKVIRSQPQTFNAPLKWHDPARVFVCSWSDFFHPHADPWRDDAWEIIRRTPHLTYLLLTKRSKNIRDRLPKDWLLPNVHLGVSVENNDYRHRIDDILEIPAASRFISVEPMLGEVDIQKYLVHGLISHVVCGGESGPGARPLNLDWVRLLRDQCILAGIPFMFKQMMVNGKKVSFPSLDGQVWNQMPA